MQKRPQQRATGLLIREISSVSKPIPEEGRSRSFYIPSKSTIKRRTDLCTQTASLSRLHKFKIFSLGHRSTDIRQSVLSTSMDGSWSHSPPTTKLSMIQYEGGTLQEPLENMRASDLRILLHYQPSSSPISNLSLREIHRIQDGTIIHNFNMRCELTRILKQHRELKHQIEYFYLQLLFSTSIPII